MTSVEIDHLADRFFAAVEAGDMDGVSALYAPHAVVWHNHDGVEQDRTRNLAVLGWIAANTTDRSYTNIRRVVIDGGFVQQHVLVGRSASGSPFEVDAMMRVWVDDGRITRIDEYLDSAQIASVTR